MLHMKRSCIPYCEGDLGDMELSLDYANVISGGDE